MSFYDFFFPEQAQASHLRTLANQSQELSAYQNRDRLVAIQKQRVDSALNKSLEQRIEQLQHELGEAGLLVEALLGLLEEAGVVSRSNLEARIAEVDSRDGVMDGAITKP